MSQVLVPCKLPIMDPTLPSTYELLIGTSYTGVLNLKFLMGVIRLFDDSALLNFKAHTATYTANEI